jgi:hypothetical protein
MSWDMWVTCFHEGELARFPGVIVDRAFEAFTDRKEPDFWRLHGSNGTLDEGPDLDGLAINRPPGFDHPFWLIEVLEQTNCVLYWAGKGAVVCGRIAHIPPDFPDRPTVTIDLDVIKEMIRNA